MPEQTLPAPRPVDHRRSRGAAAERLAENYLEHLGLAVIARNLNCKMGELDLVCLDDGVLVIVEVRQRSFSKFGGASASVTARKQHKLLRAARYFLQRQPSWRDRAIRFDVVAIDGLPEAAHRVEWIKDAFRMA